MDFVITVAIAILISLGVTASSLAQDSGMGGYLARKGIGYSLEYSDNINRSGGGNINRGGGSKESSFINTLFVDLSSSTRTSLIDAAINGRVGYQYYSNPTQNNQPIADIGAFAKFRLTPRITWVFQDNAGQVSQSATQPSVPNNQEIQNVFQTGPDLLLKINPVTYLGYGLRYGNYFFTETSEDNNQRIANALRAFYFFTDKTIISLNAVYEKAFYQEDETNDFNRLDLFLGIARIDDLTSLRFAIGTTKADQTGLDSPNSPLFCTTLKRKLTSDSYFEVGYSKLLSELNFAGAGGVACEVPILSLQDPFQSFSGVTFTPTTENTENTSSNQLFVEDRVQALYSKTFRFSTVTLGISKRIGGKGAREAEQPDEDAINLGLSYPFTENKILSTFISYSRQTDFNETVVGVGFKYRLTKEIEIGIGFTRDQVDYKNGGGDSANANTGNENRALISVAYRK